MKIKNTPWDMLRMINSAFPVHCQQNISKGIAGLSTLGGLILIFILVSGIFVASQVLPFYYSFYEIQGLMQAQAVKSKVIDDNEMRRNIGREMKKLGIPADPEEDLMINRYNGKIVIELSYEEVLYVDFGEDYDYDLWTFQFNPRGEAAL